MLEKPSAEVAAEVGDRVAVLAAHASYFEHFLDAVIERPYSGADLP